MSIVSDRPAPRRLAAGLLAAATAVAVSGCGASLDAQTYQQRSNAESSGAAVGALALRNVGVLAPSSGERYEIGDDARATVTVANAGPDEDRLIEVTSSAAREVAVVTDGAGDELVVPGQGSTGSSVHLQLRGLTRPLRPGEYVDLVFRFARNGTTEVLVPVATTGRTDRPVYTGERFEGGEEPALQAPAGGDHGAGHGGEDEEKTRKASSTVGETPAPH
ncbi:MAG: copper chaperone PCu(A)C [Mycobacteriales bacterium]